MDVTSMIRAGLEFIEERRVKQKLSRRKFTEAAGITLSCYSRYLSQSRENPSLKNTLGMLDALGIDPHDFIDAMYRER